MLLSVYVFYSHTFEGKYFGKIILAIKNISFNLNENLPPLNLDLIWKNHTCMQCLYVFCL